MSAWLGTKDSGPQPDIAYQMREEGTYADGAPELMVEMSHTTRARDALLDGQAGSCGQKEE